MLKKNGTSDKAEQNSDKDTWNSNRYEASDGRAQVVSPRVKWLQSGCLKRNRSSQNLQLIISSDEPSSKIPLVTKPPEKKN